VWWTSNTRRKRAARQRSAHDPSPELNAAQRTELVRNYSQELANRYRNAVDFAVHEPRRTLTLAITMRHLLMTAREVTPRGWGAGRLSTAVISGGLSMV